MKKAEQKKRMHSEKEEKNNGPKNNECIQKNWIGQKNILFKTKWISRNKTMHLRFRSPFARNSHTHTHANNNNTPTNNNNGPPKQLSPVENNNIEWADKIECIHENK